MAVSAQEADFQSRVGCDDRALAGLQQLPPGDRLVAMDIVEHQECKNPSAVLWSAVRQCEKAPALARMEYLLRHLDERAKEALGQLPPPVQEGICHEMDFSNVRNLSAFVFSQIRASRAGGPLEHVWNNPKAAYGKSAHALRPPMMQAMPNYGKGSRPAAVMPAYGKGKGPTGVMPACGKGKGKDAQLAAAFSLGQAAAQMPFGAFGRDRSRSPMLTDWTSGPVDLLRIHYPIDDGAARALQGLSPEDQFVACKLVEKQKPRNPSAVAWSICKLVRDKPTKAKLEYLRHVIDDNASVALDRLEPDVLEQLLSKAELSRIKNMSAFVWSRVKALGGDGGGEMEQEKPQATIDLPHSTWKARLHQAFRQEHKYVTEESLVYTTVREDAGFVSSLTSDKFEDAHISECVQTSPKLAEEAAAMVAMTALYPKLCSRAAKAHHQMEEPVAEENNLESVASMGINLDKRCQAKLAELSAEQQMEILSQVDANVRNPSAFVFSKIQYSLHENVRARKS